MSRQESVSDIFGLAGRTALVTGAANGIGREIARLYHLAGATVIAADIDGVAVDSLAAELGDRVRAVRFDQGDPASIEALFAGLDRLDVLVNCAAIYPMMPFERVEIGFFDKMVAINLRGAFLVTQQAVKLMKGKGGSVINISSVNSVRAIIFDNSVYGITKAGLNSLVATLASEYGGEGIRFNAILPGGVATDHAMNAVQDFAVRGGMMAGGRVPIGSGLCRPQDIANACLFLASDASAFVTGQLIAVDGGFLVS